MNAVDPWAFDGEPETVPAPRQVPPAGATAAPRVLATIWADDIQLDVSRPGLVDGLLEPEGITVVYGESGSGKTFAVVDLACHIAAGLAWRERPVLQGTVVYVAAEAPVSVQRRLWAWKERYGVDSLPVLVVTSGINLLSEDDGTALIAAIETATPGSRPALVVVDTLARSMVGNENAPDDMGRFVAECGRIRERFATHVLVVHHTGKDTAKGARGHSSLRAATDTEMEVSADSGTTRHLRVTKARDEDGAGVYPFELEVLNLGQNGYGREVTTCVAVPVDNSAPGSRKRKPPSQSGRLALDALDSILVRSGEVPPKHSATASATLCVKLDLWRAEFVQKAGYARDEKGKDAERKAWDRARQDLIDKGYAAVWGEFAWKC